MFKNTKIGIYLFGIIGLTISFLVFLTVNSIEKEKINNDFEQISKDIYKLYTTTINNNLNTVNFIASIFTNLKDPTREEFKKIVQNAVSFKGVTTGISWNPYVKDSQRDLYIENAKKDGLVNFTFTGINKDGKKGISEIKNDYVPVYYIEPQDKNKGALGFDISSNPTRLHTINAARDSADVTITNRINLVQKEKNSFGALAMKAVYKKNTSNNTLEQRRENFKGVVVGVFSFDELGSVVLNSLSKRKLLEDISVKLLNISDTKENQILYRSDNDFANSADLLVWKEKLNIANKQWLLEVSIKKEDIKMYQTYYAILFFIIGLLLTLFYLFYLISKHNKTQKLEDQVKEKTKEIHKQLEKIKDREKKLSEHVLYSRTDTNGIITDVSDVFCKLSGYSKDELIGKQHNVVLHPDMSKEVYKELWETIKKGQIWEGELKNRAKRGHHYWVYAQITPEYTHEGELIGYLSIRHDITAQKNLDEEKIHLHERAKMAALGEMIGNIAHQWRQPLSVISTCAGGLKFKSEYEEKIDLEFITYSSNKIVEQCMYLSKTIDTFKNFIKNKREYKEVILQEEILDGLNIVEDVLKNKFITLKNNIDPTVKIKTNLISGALQEVIINIVNNAKDALCKKGASYYKWIEVDLEIKNNLARLTIEDNGGGISDDVILHIFEPYYTTKHKSQGTGLGLHISYKIITESFNGEIYVKNTKNGAKFFIEIPLNINP